MDKNNEIKCVLGRQECDDIRKSALLAMASIVKRNEYNPDDLVRLAFLYQRMTTFIKYMDKGEGGE